MRWFKKNNADKPKVVTFYFTGGYRTFQVTSDVFDSLKRTAADNAWDTTVSFIGNSEDGGIAYINWNKVNYVDFK